MKKATRQQDADETPRGARVLPRDYTTRSTTPVSIRGAVAGGTETRHACLASLALRVSAFAPFCSRGPWPGKTGRRSTRRG